MTTNAFFIMIKPDAVARGLVGEIITRFERKGFKVKELRFLTNARPYLEQHYESFKEKSFYSDLIDFLCSGPIIIGIMNGNIEAAREIVGATIPSEAKPGTIRGDYACTLPQNLIHTSHSAEEAAHEIDLWKELLH